MTDPGPIDQAFLRKLTEIVLANLDNENFGVRDLVKKSGYSRYKIAGNLHILKNKTVNQFIREIRLRKALEILQLEEITASEVAYRVGFNNVTYFNTCFHEYFGYPPGKAKKRSEELREENILNPDIQEQEQKKPFRWNRIYFFTIFLILTGMGYLLYILFSGASFARKSNIESIPDKSIAVLPFRNDSEVITDQYIYDGIMEEIFNSLTKIHVLRIISRTSVEQYRNTTKSIPEIGKNLGVNYIVEGSGQKIGNTFRLRVQLIEVSTDKQIWSKPYQQRMNNTKKFFRIQSKIANDIASELEITLNQDEKKLIEKVPTANIMAFDLYLKANSFQKDIKNTRNDNSYKTAVDLYNAALKNDPAFAKAYTGLAFAYWNRYYYETYFEKNYLDSCLALAEKALKYDALLDEAYFIKGEYYRVKGQAQEALNNYDKALEINPNFYQAYPVKGYLFAMSFGDYVKALDNYNKGLTLFRGTSRHELLTALAYDYLCVGFIDKAKFYYQEAYALINNKSAYMGNLAWTEFCQGNFEKALDYKNKQREIDPATSSLLYYSVISGHNKERYLDAEKYIGAREKSGTLALQSSHRIGYAFWQEGKKKMAEYYFDQQIKYSEESIKLNRITSQRKTAHYDLAATYAFLGDKVKAYAYLEDANKKNVYPLWWIVLIKNDPMFNNIRNEERFQNIVRNMESKYNAEHERVRKWLSDQRMI